MNSQSRSEAGRFLPKSEENRQVRSIRLTDAVWDELGQIASEQKLTRADFLENLVNKDMLNLYNRVIELELEVDRLKKCGNEDNINLSKKTIETIDKLASLRSITPSELIDWMIESDIIKDKLQPVTENQVTVTKLAKILNVDAKTIRDYKDGKRTKTLIEWSRSKTVDRKAWDYDPGTKKYFQVD